MRKKLHFRRHNTLTSRNYHSFFSKTTSLWYCTEWVINLMFCMQQGYWDRDSFVKAGAWRRKGLSSPDIDPSTGFPPDAWIGKQIARIYQLLLLFWGAQKVYMCRLGRSIIGYHLWPCKGKQSELIFLLLHEGGVTLWRIDYRKVKLIEGILNYLIRKQIITEWVLS